MSLREAGLSKYTQSRSNCGFCLHNPIVQYCLLFLKNLRHSIQKIMSYTYIIFHISIPIISFQPQNNHVGKVRSSLSAVRKKAQFSSERLTSLATVTRLVNNEVWFSKLSLFPTEIPAP